MRAALVLLVAGLTVAGCNFGESGELVPIENPHPELTPLPDPEEQGGNVGRAPRRLTVAQLDRSILVATGREWTDLPRYATSLGAADYALANTENTEANLVFAKFLEDGARKVCLATASADLATPDAADRILSPEIPATVTDWTAATDEQVRANLRHLSLRFWGSELEREELDAYVSLFQRAAVRGKAINQRRQVWGVVCIALMTDPRFFTY